MQKVKFVGSSAAALVLALMLGLSVTDFCLFLGLNDKISVLVGDLISYPVFGTLFGGFYLYFFDRGSESSSG
jgi:hypothetical protein